MLLRQVQLARDVGALDQLPIDLASLGTATAWTGDLTAVSALIAEADAVRAATGSRTAPFAAMLLASLRGDQAEATPLIEAAIADAPARGQGIAETYAHWAAAILANGLGRYADALAAAQQASQDSPALYVAMWALPELIEAATRTGNAHIASDALARLAETTQAGATDFGLGMEARSRALVSEGETAERCYREAIDRLGRTQLRPELARAHLVYGEWLHRENRRRDARAELRTAYDLFTAIGMGAFRDGPGVSCWPPATRCASGRSRRPASSPPRRRTSPGSRSMAAPTRKSGPSYSSAPGPSNGISARCTPSSASAHAESCRGPWPASGRQTHRPSDSLVKPQQPQ